MTSEGIDILRVKLKNKNEVNGGWEQLRGESRAFARTVWTIQKVKIKKSNIWSKKNHKVKYFYDVRSTSQNQIFHGFHLNANYST